MDELDILCRLRTASGKTAVEMVREYEAEFSGIAQFVKSLLFGWTEASAAARLTDHLETLERNGWVVSEKDADDRTLWSVTESGVRLAGEMLHSLHLMNQTQT